MFLSKHPNGTYYLFFHDELGARRKVSTKCRRKSEAAKFFQNFKVGERDRRISQERKRLSQFKEDFLAYSRTVHTLKTQACFETAFREFLKKVGDAPLHLINVREIERFLSDKTSEASIWTARKYYTALASAFETAKKWKCISVNPFRQVEKPKAPEVQPAHFTKKDFQEIMKGISEVNFRELCICAVSTGLRLGELISLQWTDVDFVRKVLTVKNSETFTTKNKKIRVVAMSEQLWRMLAMRKDRASSELVFHFNGQQLSAEKVSKTFKEYVRAARLNEKLHFHSLRHTFATWLVQDGASIYEVQKLLGHSSIAVTQIYSHLAPSELHSVVNRISLS
jgi:site-specific recombinase XerD